MELNRVGHDWVTVLNWLIPTTQYLDIRLNYIKLKIWNYILTSKIRNFIWLNLKNWCLVLNCRAVQFSLVAQSCLTLCDPMNLSTPDLPVHHQLPEFTQIHVHQVSDAIQPSHSLSFSSVQFSHSVVSDSWRPHELQHARPPCPSPTPRVYSNSCPSSRWCHPAISSSVVPFSSCPQSLPASGSLQWVNSSHEVARVLEFQLQHQSFQWTPRTNLL